MTFIFKHFVSHYQMNRWLDSRQNIQQNFLGIVNRFYFTNFVYVFAASFIYVFKNVANLCVFNQLVYFVRNVSHILVLNYLNFIYLLLNHSHTHIPLVYYISHYCRPQLSYISTACICLFCIPCHFTIEHLEKYKVKPNLAQFQVYNSLFFM